jgi:hypothetical protein
VRRDTIYTLGVETPTDATLDCAGRAIAIAMPPIVATLTELPNTDLRDVLDRSAHWPDVIVTSDPDVIAYAARTSAWLVAPLPWVTTYALAGPDSVRPNFSPADRDALARDAVSVEARGAEPPFAWLTDSTCAFVAAVQPGEARPIIGYPAGDAIARQLAERIAARGAVTRRVAPFAASQLPSLIADRNIDLIVLPIARDASMKCGTRGNTPVLRGAAPLVDTRSHVIVRRGSGAAFVVASDGTLRFIRRAAP